MPYRVTFLQSVTYTIYVCAIAPLYVSVALTEADCISVTVTERRALQDCLGPLDSLVFCAVWLSVNEDIMMPVLISHQPAGTDKYYVESSNIHLEINFKDFSVTFNVVF